MSIKPVVLVDGSSYLFRAFYALPNLSSAEGFPTGAILGVLNMLNRLIEKFDPEYLGVVFDAKGKNFRHELFPAYKANRIAMPEELRVQISPLHECIRALGLPLIIQEGVEADDVIGTLAQKASSSGYPVLISSGDKDMAQLVNSEVTVMDTMKEANYDEEGVLQKFGVKPHQMIDYLSLVGDSSDNIRGVEGVGPKTAVKWLNQYGSLSDILIHQDEISGKVGENLRASRETLVLAQSLIKICCDLPSSWRLEDLHRKPPELQILKPLLEKYGLKTWLKKWEGPNPVESEKVSISPQYSSIQTQEQFQSFLKTLKAQTTFAFDSETTSLDEELAELVGLSFSWKSGEAVYLPLGHRGLDNPLQLDLGEVLAALKPIFAEPESVKIAQNLKYDLKVLSRYGVLVSGKCFDTMLASYVLEAGQTRYDLETLALRHLNQKTLSYESLTGKGAKAICFSEVAVDLATQYAAEDADITFRLYEYLSEKIRATSSLQKVFETIEMPLLPVLMRMEQRGVLIDSEKLLAQSREIEQSLLQLEKLAFEEAGQAFNLASPKQLQQILFEKMQLPIRKNTPGGQASTSEEVLQELAENYRLPSLILEHRHLSKLKSTYTDKLPLEVNPRTGRVHTHYLQTGAATGRLASSEPNLQNIPIRTEQGRRIRQAFIAPPGYQLLAADYSQVELRIMAHFSEDPALIQAFSRGEDIHRATASEIFGLELEKVTPEMRRHAKAINFGLIYGMSAFGLAKQLRVSREDAQTYLNRYFERYPKVAAFMERVREQAGETGYVETLFGRRLYVSGLQDRRAATRKGAERAAINAPLQGTAADIIKKAMLSLDKRYAQDESIRMLMQVHDELVFEVREEKIPQARIEIAQEMMQAGAGLRVPLLVGIGVGENWEVAH